MSWKFDEKSPIYVQIAQHIKMQIISQEIKSGDQLPTVRELAEEAGVNPNTMQRAFSELEREGMVTLNELLAALLQMTLTSSCKNVAKLLRQNCNHLLITCKK